MAASAGLQGIAASGGKVFAAVSRQRKITLLDASAVPLAPIAGDIGGYNAGAITAGSSGVLIPVTLENLLAVVDPAKGAVVKKIPTGKAPFGVVMNAAGTVAWVSNWGGRIPGEKDTTAPTGTASNSDRVVVDVRGIASSGTVSRIDLATGDRHSHSGQRAASHRLGLGRTHRAPLRRQFEQRLHYRR